MSDVDFQRVALPEGSAYLATRCACCGGSPGAWQRVARRPGRPELVQRAIMCDSDELRPPGEEPDGFGLECPFALPPEQFYAPTLREAVAFWNRTNGLLIEKRAENAANARPRPCEVCGEDTPARPRLCCERCLRDRDRASSIWKLE